MSDRFARYGQTPVDHFFRNENAQCFSNGFGFNHGLSAEFAQIAGCDLVECRMRQGTDRIETDVTPQFQPDVPSDGVTDGSVEIRRFHRFRQRHDAAGFAAVGFA